ncbi:hypothetical protein D9756_000670 [Leucocoprinus leucothites]|uniref:RING-type domain-containing protein n=1 Tax=Leucocoprinus leucothites TaxID=201217 RepID=A0A8H5GE06_9AGAR|nr:hypothetical protein D9756_000670 [Leucoagaricus leucothites]
MDTFLARAAALQLVQDAILSSANSETVKNFIQDLPVLPREQIPLEDNCPICLLPFVEILQDEEESTEKGLEEKEGDKEVGGITKLEECGHIFCRRDLVEWIKTHHLSCPTCRSRFIQINTYQDDASSDGGEYLPSSEGEDDIEVDADLFEVADLPSEDRYDLYQPDWEDDIESAPVVDPEIEEREAMMEDGAAWMYDYDPEYDDVGVEDGSEDVDFNSEMVEGILDPEFEPMIEDAGEADFDPCLQEADPDVGSLDPGFVDEGAGSGFDSIAVEDGIWEPPGFGPAEEEEPPEFDPIDGEPWDPPDFDLTEMEGEANDEDFDPGLTMDQTSEDFTDDPGLPLEELGYEPDSDPVFEGDYAPDYMDEARLEEIYTIDDSLSDSEQEALEVELGLTDGESNTSSSSEEEIQGPAQLTPIQISVDGDKTGETIISHTYDPQPLK